MDWNGIFENAVSAAFGVDAVIFALAAIGLNVHYGYTGLLNFGQVGFLAAGAYGLGITVLTLEWGLFAGVIMGMLFAVVLALLLGIPTLRLRADYLAIVTIAAGEIIRITARAANPEWLKELTGGSNGLNGMDDSFIDASPFDLGTRYEFGPFGYQGRDLWIMTVGWGIVLASVGVVFLLMRSPWGRVVKAIREDEDAVRSLGKNVFAYKMQSLVLGGVFGAFGGMVLSMRGSIQPEGFATPITFFAFTALILGGAGRVWGPVVGSMIFWAMLSLTEGVLRESVGEEIISRKLMDGVQVGQVRFILVGVGLISLMIFRPQGIFGDRRELALDER